MPGQVIVIPGFSGTDRVPGYYGETKYGVGPTSASSIPIKVLLVGQKTSGGSAVANQDINAVQSNADADALYGAGSELACMCYGALKIPGVALFAAPPAAAGGAVAATLTVVFAGSWTTTGTYAYRINGETRSITVSTVDTPTTIAAAVAADINSVAAWPVSATSSVGSLVMTLKTAGIRGNQQIFFHDVSKVPAGLTTSFTGGTALNTASANGMFFASGAGTETLTTLLGLINTAQYDRIAVATNDSVSLAAWKVQIDAQSGPTVGILQHLVYALNGTYSAAQSLSFTTVNHWRMQEVWSVDNEQAPSVIAAVTASIRSSFEQNDPDASFDDVILPGVPPQALRADWPSHATLVSCVNNGITALYSTADGYCKIVRSIVTHCNNAGTPDYSTLDTSDAVVPDYVRADLRLVWIGYFKPSNPRNADDPPDASSRLAPGIASPSTWNATVEGKLRDYEAGKGFPAPIIINVDGNKPVSGYDKIAKRIMSAVTVVPAPNNHQIGVSVRQAAS